MIKLGTFFMRTESELVLKSRRVVPGRLQEAGFDFEYPEWSAAARDLVARWRDQVARRKAGSDTRPLLPAALTKPYCASASSSQGTL